MALSNDIRDLADRSLAELDDCHNYFTDTKAVWRLLQQQVKKKDLRFRIRNITTGKTIDQEDLPGLAQHYVTDYLLGSTFQHFVSLFESFFFDLLQLWLTYYPRSLSNRQVPFGEILDAPDKDAVTVAIVERKLNELRYERVADWFAYLDEIMRLACPASGTIEALAEIKASRDILVHNKGIVNTVYLSKAGSHARYADGERLEIPPAYHEESWRTIRSVIRELSDAAIMKATNASLSP